VRFRKNARQRFCRAFLPFVVRLIRIAKALFLKFFWVRISRTQLGDADRACQRQCSSHGQPNPASYESTWRCCLRADPKFGPHGHGGDPIYIRSWGKQRAVGGTSKIGSEVSAHHDRQTRWKQRSTLAGSTTVGCTPSVCTDSIADNADEFLNSNSIHIFKNILTAAHN
jgi:hypothetical protein